MCPAASAAVGREGEKSKMALNRCMRLSVAPSVVARRVARRSQAVARRPAGSLRGSPSPPLHWDTGADRQTELSTAEAVDDPREGVSKLLESSTLAVIARSPLRAAAPPTPATTTSHALLADVAMPVHDRNVLVQLVLLALHRSNISCAGAPAC